MFADGNRRVWFHLEQQRLPSDPRERIKVWLRVFVRFCCDDPALYQLLYQRSVSGFEPSPPSMQLANRLLERGRAMLADAGFRGLAASDLVTAIGSGLISQQLANDPGGDRWIRHLDRLTDMYLDEPKRRKRR